MRLKKWQKEIRSAMEKLLAKIPPQNKERSYLEMRHIIHMDKVLQRKRQIALTIDDSKVHVTSSQPPKPIIFEKKKRSVVKLLKNLMP